jgi:hypothetical protein
MKRKIKKYKKSNRLNIIKRGIKMYEVNIVCKNYNIGYDDFIIIDRQNIISIYLKIFGYINNFKVTDIYKNNFIFKEVNDVFFSYIKGVLSIYINFK